MAVCLNKADDPRYRLTKEHWAARRPPPDSDLKVNAAAVDDKSRQVMKNITAAVIGPQSSSRRHGSGHWL